MSNQYNKTGPDYFEWLKSRGPINERKQPEGSKRLKSALDAFDERRLKREQDEEFDIGEDDEG